MAEKVVLAYSGGLDTSVIIPWLKETYGYDVIAYAADMGQGEIDTPKEKAALKKKAILSGASKVYIEDQRHEFVTEYAFPVMKMGARYEGRYLLGTSFARPLIAKRQMEIAKKEGARAVAHGATGKGNDQVRFELTYMSMDPAIKIVAPWKDDRWAIRSREDAIDYGRARGIPLPVTKKKIYSQDGNLWHLSHEGGELESPKNEPLNRVYSISVPPEKAPNRPEYVTVHFDRGIPVKVNGKAMDPVKLLYALNEIGGRNGVGQIDIVENRLVGMKSRGVYETPGGSILVEAHDYLETLVLDKNTQNFKKSAALRYAELVYNGEWFTPLKKALDTFVDATQRHVTGWVKLKLYKGNIRPAGMDSPNSLYQEKLSSFTDDLSLYDQKDAVGFIRLFGLPLATRARKGLK